MSSQIRSMPGSKGFLVIEYATVAQRSASCKSCLRNAASASSIALVAVRTSILVSEGHRISAEPPLESKMCLESSPSALRLLRSRLKVELRIESVEGVVLSDHRSSINVIREIGYGETERRTRIIRPSTPPISLGGIHSPSCWIEIRPSKWTATDMMSNYTRIGNRERARQGNCKVDYLLF